MPKQNDWSSLSQKLIRIGRIGWDYARNQLPEQKMSNAQYKVCMAVHDQPGCSQYDIARYLGMDKSSITKLVSKSINGNFIYREVNPNDGREYKLYLTDAGMEATEEFIKYLKMWEDQLFAEFGEERYNNAYERLINLEKVAEEMEEQ